MRAPSIAEPPALDRRGRRTLANHERILDCAIELFAERGYEATSFDDIAERADVARQTAFNHFPQKRFFLEEWGNRHRDVLRTRLDGARVGSTTERLAQAIAEWADYHERERWLSRPLVCASARYAGGSFDEGVAASDRVLAEAIRAGQARGDVRADVDADLAGHALFDTVLGVVLRWSGGEEPPPGALAASAAQSCAIVLAGLELR